MSKENNTSSINAELVMPSFSLLQAQRTADGIFPEILPIGIDAEWLNPPKTEDGLWNPEGERKLLCYSACVFAGSHGEGHYIFHVKDGVRLKFREFLDGVLGRFCEEHGLSTVPKTILLVGHWTTADLSAFSDFDKFKNKFDGVKRSYISLTDCYGAEGGENSQGLKIWLRDSMLIAPGKAQKLDELGMMIGIPKLKLEKGQIERMDELRDTNPKLFNDYAIRDAEIAVKYYLCYFTFVRDIVPDSNWPVTLSVTAQDYVISRWEALDIDKLKVLGKEVVEEEAYDWDSQQTQTKKRTVDLDEVDEWSALAVAAYHGGLNQCYEFGPSNVEEHLDFDIKGAYPTALASLGMPRWEDAHPTTNPEDFQVDTLGFARLDFEFPESVRFPCIPVRSKQGALVFPRRGRKAHATSAEIALAVKLGASVNIRNGVVIPVDPPPGPFEVVVKELFDMRKHMESKFGKGNPEALLVKEIANCIYGKGAQGLRLKRAFDARRGKPKKMPRSKLTQPFIAAYVTGLIRACLSEILNSLPGERSVLTVTTDGFLTNATAREVLRASRGTVCTFLKTVRRRLTNKPALLEIKHSVMQAIVFSRRSVITVLPSGRFKEAKRNFMLAKAGIKPDCEKDKKVQNEWLLEKFLTRKPGETYIASQFPSQSDLFHGRVKDFVEIRRPKRLRMDYDFSCKPDKFDTRVVKGVVMVHFTTKPWDTLDEYHQAREEWRREWREKVVMRDEAVVRQFMNRQAVPKLKGANRAMNETVITQCVKELIRACRQECAGLSTTLTPAELARKVTGALYRLGVDWDHFVQEKDYEGCLAALRAPESGSEKDEAVIVTPSLVDKPEPVDEWSPTTTNQTEPWSRWCRMWSEAGAGLDDNDHEVWIEVFRLTEKLRYDEVALPKILNWANNACKRKKEDGKLVSPFHPQSVAYCSQTTALLEELGVDLSGGGFRPDEFFHDFHKSP